MKRNFTLKKMLFSGMMIAVTNGFAQFDLNCVDFESLKDDVSSLNDDVNYPAGSAIVSAGDLDIVKTHQSATMPGSHILGLTPGNDGLNFYSWLTMDVSKSKCVSKSLSFTASVPYVIVDGDTVTSFPYTGSSFTVQTAFSNVSEMLVSGNFNKVVVGGNTGTLSNVCFSASSCELTSAGELKASTLINKAYPNPSNGKLFIDLKSSISGVKVHNMIGEVVYNESVTDFTYCYVYSDTRG